jgi:hypothetical protein
MQHNLADAGGSLEHRTGYIAVTLGCDQQTSFQVKQHAWAAAESAQGMTDARKQQVHPTIVDRTEFLILSVLLLPTAINAARSTIALTATAICQTQTPFTADVNAKKLGTGTLRVPET